jgi:pimeloyl-ACP methyl ester carboxylesterase
MAIFGAPVAHEDHAVRACYAALAMQDAVRTTSPESGRQRPIEIRVGLHAGEVVVRAINTDLSMTYDAVGPTVHLAARMESHAPPGEIYLTADTLRLVEGFVAVEPRGRMAVKGLTEPVAVFALRGTGARTRWQAALARGLTRFVGRQAALETLTQALNQAAAGQGQLAAIIGEAGVGKSRLVYEFVRSLPAQQWQVLAGSTVSYGKATTWLPVIDLLKGYFGIREKDDATTVSGKIRQKLEQLDESLRMAAAPFVALLDVPVNEPEWQALGTAQQRGRTLNALQTLFLRESERQPLLLVFEDLHWIDSETQALLDELVERLPGARLMLVVNYRPEYVHHWGNKSYYLQMRLDPLAQADAEALLQSLLGDDLSLVRLKAALLERTEGNPLFVEESVRTLVETEILLGEAGAYRLRVEPDVIHLPSTIQGIMAERIDRLPPPDKTLLQTAAVVGTHVPLSLLRTIASCSEEQFERSLDTLRAAEFVYQSQLFPEPEYTFKHAHTHQVAYEGLLHQRRRGLHARVAEALQSLYPERRVELAEKVAEHFENGELWEQSIDHYLLAAEKGKGKFAYAAAMNYARKALMLADKGAGDARKIRAQVLLGDLASLQGDLAEANAAYERALALAADNEQRRDITDRLHRRRFAWRDGARIAYYEHGVGSTVLLFVSTQALGLSAFQPIVEELCHDFKVVTVDPRGTGNSAPLQRPYPLAEHVADVRAVVKELSPQRLIGVGISMGGNLLFQLVHDEPALLDKLVTIGAPTAGNRRPFFPSEWLRLFKQVNAGGDVEPLLRLHVSLVFSEPEMRHLVETFVQTRLSQPREALLSFFDADPSNDVTDILPDIQTPTLVTHGSEDRLVAFEAAELTANLLPKGVLRPFRGKGHLPLFTATHEFCQVLREFID